MANFKTSLVFKSNAEQIKENSFINPILISRCVFSIILAAFISACTTTKEDTAGTSGSGAASTSTETTSSDAATIEPGSQEDLIVNVGDRVFFGYDSSELDSDAQQLLQEQAAWLKQYSDVSITIEGHCDERGTREYNLALGEQRAQAVKNWLILLGINTSRLSTISYGKERPAVVGSNDGAWSQNRRSVTTVN